jgi:hypothetical protein
MEWKGLSQPYRVLCWFFRMGAGVLSTSWI